VKKLILVIPFLIAGCGYDGHYRYECQEPSNWNSEECNPPICKVDGACSKDLIGFDPDSYTETTVESTQVEGTITP
jgi:hypothetical protein